ncbi:MAG: hypothetical protein JO340_19540 [Acidobacteriaceae bacterium]|nr:hypothetical protein [Acidobacteriaceae bacterium]
MKSELNHIDDDREAFRWAVGCVIASYVERTKTPGLFNSWYGRGFLTIPIAAQVASMIFAPLLMLSHRRNWISLATFLGSFTPGDDYRRFIPLMNATPWWLYSLWIVASLLFLLSAAQLLRRRRSSFWLFVAAFLIGAVGDLISRLLPAYRTAFSFPEPMFTRDYLVPILTAAVTAAPALGLWMHGRGLASERYSRTENHNDCVCG